MNTDNRKEALRWWKEIGQLSQATAFSIYKLNAPNDSPYKRWEFTMVLSSDAAIEAVYDFNYNKYRGE